MLLNSRGPSDELCLRLAKTVIAGGFKGADFNKMPLRDLFPTQNACPHCQGRRGRRVWDISEAARMLADMGKLAREIKQKQLCRSCLSQLNELAEARRKLKKLGKGDPRSLSTRSSGWVRTFLLLVAVSAIVALLSFSLSLLPFLLRLMVELPTIMFRY